MTKLKHYCQLMRLDKPIGTLLLLWPTLWSLYIATNGQPSLKLIIVFCLGVLLMRSSGCVISDYADVEFDKHVERTNKRVLVSGDITKKSAMLLSLALSLVAALLAVSFLKLNTILMCIPALFIAMTYPLMKRFFPFPQLYLGVAFSFGILMSFIEVQNNIPIIGWLLFIANLLWTFGYDTIYALVDKPDDIKLSLYSSAKTLGAYVIPTILICYLLFIVIMIQVGIIESFDIVYYLGIIIAFMMLLYQLWQIRSQDRNICFKMFLLNNRVGFIVFLGVITNYTLS